jgi:P pilus assembly chaperone PapD
LAIALLLACAPRIAVADGFQVRPLLVETRGGSLGSLTVTNPGDHRIYLETSVYDWTQDASGRDVLSESPTAVVSPPAVWVGPRTTYNLRVQLPPAGDRELAFRVLVQQVPDKSEFQAGRIVFAVTQRLPAFSEPPELPPPALHARIIDKLHLLVTNEGGRRARLSDLKADGRVVAPGLLGYALAHSSVSIALTTPVRPGTIEVETDLGRRTVDAR